MKCLFEIFLLSAALFCHFLSAADFVSHPDKESSFALRRLTGYISGNFRVAKKSVEVEILSDPVAVPGEPFLEYMPKRRARITINPADDWTRDHDFCRKLIFLLLKLKTGCPAINGSDLPDWFVFGIAQAAQERTGSARLARNSHSFVLLEQLAVKGKFYNPEKILPLKLSTLTPEELPFYFEYAKLVIHTLESAGKFSHFSAILAESRRIDRRDFDRIAAEYLKNQNSKYISASFRKELWSNLNPPPEDFTRKCFEEAYVVPVPELDGEGAPTGKVEYIPLDGLPALYERPDYYQLCRIAASGLLAVSIGESREVRRELAGLRMMFEQEARIFSAAAVGVEQNRQKAANTGNVKQKKTADKNVSSGTAGQDQLKNELMDLTRKFYKEKVISGNPQKVVNSKGSAGAKPVIQGRPEAEPEKIRKTAENIRQMLDERKALRRQLDETAGRNRSVRQTIFVRSQFLNSANDSVSNWLERVENSLL